MTENALQIYEQFGQLQQAASALYKSGYFTDAKSEAQAMVKVMAGAELGLPPFASMTGINIIQGKPAIGANVVATLVKNDRRYDYRVKQADATTCTLLWFESGKQVGESSFTIAEAQAAGLATKDNWKKFPSDMLFARAITRGARRYAPGIFGGAPVYTPEELGADVDEDGVIIEGSYAAPEPTAVTKPEPPQPQKPAAKQAAGQKPTIAMLNKLHAIGTQKFGPEWDDARHELVGKLTDGRSQSSKDLTYEEVVKFAEMLKAFSDYVEGELFEDDNDHTEDSLSIY